MDKVDFLENTIGTGEVIKIRYQGGSHPGDIRDIVVNKCGDEFLQGYCLNTRMHKTFNIKRIAVIAEDGQTLYDAEDKTLSLQELYDTYKNEWEQAGWIISTYSEKPDNKYIARIHLKKTQKEKRKARKRNPELIIFYGNEKRNKRISYFGLKECFCEKDHEKAINAFLEDIEELENQHKEYNDENNNQNTSKKSNQRSSKGI